MDSMDGLADLSLQELLLVSAIVAEDAVFAAIPVMNFISIVDK